MAKPSENQTKAVAGLQKVLTDNAAIYATLSSWKKGVEKGTMVTVGSLVGAGLVEEITIVNSGKPAKVYRPKV